MGAMNDFAVSDEIAPVPRVLVVDDDSDILDNIRFILKNFQVESTTSPLEALEKLKEKKFLVVLSDYQMPEMNGVEFLKKTQEIDPKIKRVMISAFVDMLEGEELWNQAKVHRVVAKPFQPEELVDVVENAIFESVIEAENAKLRKLALSDSLTGVANQRYFWDRLRSEFSRAQRFKRPLSVVIFDVDTFKNVNDQKGHLEGDALLKNIADVFTKETRQMDVVARYGGDEFAVILPEIEASGAQTIATRLSEKMLQQLGVSLSGGVASTPPCTSERDLVALADKNLLRAKKEAKGQVLQ